jgi:hypothetical protein
MTRLSESDDYEFHEVRNGFCKFCATEDKGHLLLLSPTFSKI